MRSPCVGAVLDPPLLIVPNKALSLSLARSLSRVTGQLAELQPGDGVKDPSFVFARCRRRASRENWLSRSLALCSQVY
jgi:hypothetical protein